MPGLGSAFLGDVGRNRRISSPPSTPSSTHSRSASSPMNDASATNTGAVSGVAAAPLSPSKTSVVRRPVPQLVAIEPALSLELRLRWLEALLVGMRQDAKGGTATKGKEKEKTRLDLKHGDNLVRLAQDVQRRLTVAVESNEGLNRFMQLYDQHVHLLMPSFALSPTLAAASPPSYGDMGVAEFEAMLAEMEPDIRAADRDLREIEMLEKKGVTSAGKLVDFESLRPRLQALLKAHEEDLQLAALLERRIATLIDKHAIHVDALSELFVAWDDTVTETEIRVTKTEKEKKQRQRLGLEE